MNALRVELLGPFRVIGVGRPVVGLASDKVRALLAYIAVEAHQPHRREKLVGLLWPDQPEQTARANLRRALSNLRKTIGDGRANPPFLLVSRQTVQFNTASDAWVDVTAFQAALESEGETTSIERMERAIELYQGSFLEGFSVKDSASFEDWTLLTRERLQRKALAALDHLARHYAEQGHLDRACDYAWRQVEIEPWQEKPYQQLMRLLALAGRRSEALAQYDVCRRRLADELGVEPSPATTRLHERIRTGTLGPGTIPPAPVDHTAGHFPCFLHDEHTVEPERPTFVARDRELAQLHGFLDRALADKGQVAFVAGEAGTGKTMLLQEFIRRAQENHRDLVAARGRGTAYTGAGDAYLPFREILALLTGDVDAGYSAGTIGRDQALRLWNSLPGATLAVVEKGPDLIDTLIPGASLLRRARAYASGGADWLDQLETLQQRKAKALSTQQIELFEQVSQVLALLARRAPLLLVLDDLQWVDSGSIDLLFHLGRSLKGHPVLLLGAYRPEEIATGRRAPPSAERQTERHPLDPVLHEFQRRLGDITVILGQDGDRPFLDAFVDSEPNRLGTDFRDTLYRQTRGHALFTVELMRGLQDRGDLVQDDQGRWTEGQALDWEALPPRVEGVIAQRISRLPKAWQQDLRAASVQGEVFIAELLARVQGADEAETVRRLSGDLCRHHRLVQADSLDRRGYQLLSRYRFRHFLFQRYLYQGLDAAERPRLHQATGCVLEDLYGQNTEEVAVQLARHFQEARMTESAVRYLHQAGDRSVRLAANQEAIAHFTRALELLRTLPETIERDQTEFDLQIALGASMVATMGYGAPEIRLAWGRALQLSERLPNAQEQPELAIARYLKATNSMAQGEFRDMLRVTQQMIDAAESQGDRPAFPLHHAKHGVALFYLGQFGAARNHLELAVAGYDRDRDSRLILTAGQDFGVATCVFLAWTLWFQGYPDRALDWRRKAIDQAESLGHTYTLIFAESLVGWLRVWRRDAPEELLTRGEALLPVCHKHGFWLMEPMAIAMKGCALIRLGAADEGEALLRRGFVAWQAVPAVFHRDNWLAWLAEACATDDHADEGLELLDEALNFIEETDQRFFEAEVLRLRGDLHLLLGNETEAETCYRSAISVARQQGARLPELRATTSLCRLLQQQSKRGEALELLSEVYGWFTEGFDTADLKDSRDLLDELGSA